MSAILIAAATCFLLLTASSANAQTSTSYYSATTQSACTSAGGEGCPAYMGGTAWCTMPGGCPINDEATCSSKGRTWCPPMSGSSMGWCSMAGYSCTGGTTTTNTTTQTTTQPTTTTNTTTQTTTQTTTTAAPAATPAATSYYTATNSADCITRGGEWCPAMNGGNAWCGTIGTCPITDKTTCESKGRSWCTSTFGGGGCTTAGYDCSGNFKGLPATTTQTQQQTTTDTAKTTTEAVKTTTPTQTFTWPQTKSECDQYSAKWCGGDTSGYCTMPQRNCFVPAKPGFMTCWDGNMVSYTSVCATMPTTEIACGQAGKFWCNYNVLQNGTAQSGGFCSAELCSPAPPTGKMTCPDGRTFAASLTECPHKTPKSFTCIDGAVVTDMSACSVVKKDEVSLCLEAKGTWCADKSGSSKGFCAINNMTCSVKPEPKEMDIAKREAEKKVIEFKKQQTEKESQMTDRDRFKEREVSEAAQQRGLQQMKSGIKNLEKNIKGRKAQIEKMQKNKVVVDEKIVGLINSALELVTKVLNAASYDDARDSMEQLPDYFEELNEVFPKLEHLSRLPAVVKSLNKQVARSAKSLKAAQTLAKRQKLSPELVDGAQTALDAARASLKTLGENASSIEDIEDFVQTEVVDKLEAVDDAAETVNALGNLRKHTTQLEAKVRMIQKKMVAAQKAGADVSDDETALAKLKAAVTDLKALAKQKLTADRVSEVRELIETAMEAVDDLEENLNIDAPGNFQKEINNSLQQGGTDFKELQVTDLEKLIVRAFNTSFKRSVTRNFAFQ